MVEQTKVFLCYNFKDENVVGEISYYLRKQGSIIPYFYSHEKKLGPFPPEISRKLNESDVFILILGPELGKYQEEEVKKWLEDEARRSKRLFVNISGARPPAQLDEFCKHLFEIKVQYPSARTAQDCARAITDSLGITWTSTDGLPVEFIFDYEKDIIRAYLEGKGRLSSKYVRKGAPPTWPEVKTNHAFDNEILNPIPEDIVGKYLEDQTSINVDARTLETESDVDGVKVSLTFPEARPQKKLRISTKTNPLKVGILVSGGIAPGINAVISGIINRHRLYESNFRKKSPGYGNIQCYGYLGGLNSLLGGRDAIKIDYEEVKRKSSRGGSLLTTSRADVLLDFENPADRHDRLVKIAHKLNADCINILYMIGGEGSMRAAHAIWTIYHENYPKEQFSVVGIPKTMDNDILWVWQSFGFVSAVERARQTIMQLHTEVSSNPRLSIIQLFGSDSGFVVSHAALGSGVCDLPLIPEMEFTMSGVAELILHRLRDRWQSPSERGPHGMIVMAETAIPTDVDDYIDDEYVGLTEDEKTAISNFQNNNRRVRGQTPDDLRSGGLKVVSKVLEKKIREQGGDHWRDFRVLTNEPRHLIRSMPPSVTDVIYGQRLGTLAVDNAMAGYTDFMVSQWLTEYVLVPLDLVVLGRKRVPLDGIFWKSVEAHTGKMETIAKD